MGDIVKAIVTFKNSSTVISLLVQEEELGADLISENKIKICRKSMSLS